jgi:hypothetical protein
VSCANFQIGSATSNTPPGKNSKLYRSRHEKIRPGDFPMSRFSIWRRSKSVRRFLKTIAKMF